jgi:alpha-glucosidase
MQWDERGNAGFSSGRPWLPIEASYAERNVARLSRDPQSILSFYHRLIELRRARRALQVGDVRAVTAENDVLAYERVNDGQRMLVMLNFSTEPQPLPVSLKGNAHVLLSTHMDREGSCGLSELCGNEGIVVESELI